MKCLNVDNVYSKYVFPVVLIFCAHCTVLTRLALNEFHSDIMQCYNDALKSGPFKVLIFVLSPETEEGQRAETSFS